MRAVTESDGRVTRVRVVAETAAPSHAQDIIGHGEARCRPDDIFSFDLGEQLATGRAIQDFGRQLEDRANARTVTHEEFLRVVSIVLDDNEKITNGFGA